MMSKENNFSGREVYQDKIRGCLLGGAAGDALGYPVEFLAYDEILRRYGENGIQSYSLDFEEGLALVSDDTQMTLYTAIGILYRETRYCERGIAGPISSYVHRAYMDWVYTQTRRAANPEYTCSWLLDIPELRARRAPGNTCLNALLSGKCGSVSYPLNQSKGCGGVMRVAPLALAYIPRGGRKALDRDSAEIAAITHGHPLGYLPAAILNHIISIGVYGGCERGDSLPDAVEDALETVRDLFKDIVEEGYLEKMEALVRKAVSLAANGEKDIENIRALGQGWTGNEALAIAVYCSLRYQDDFSRAIIAAVNHSGDSDSTGAVTGNLLGAWLGYDAIEEKWKRNLELKRIILEMADDLYQGCPLDGYSANSDPIWECKYIAGRYARTEEEARKKIKEWNSVY